MKESINHVHHKLNRPVHEMLVLLTNTTVKDTTDLHIAQSCQNPSCAHKDEVSV